MNPSFQYENFRIRREGATIFVREAATDRSSLPRTELTIDSNEEMDHYEIRGTKDNETFAWDIDVTTYGVTAVDVRGNGGPSEIKEFSLAGAVLPPESFEQAAFSMAGSIVGLPLSLLAYGSRLTHTG